MFGHRDPILLVRYRDLGEKKGLRAQKRDLSNPLIAITYFISKLLFPNSLRDAFWVDFTDLNNRKYDIDQELNELTARSKDLIAESKAVEEWIKQQRVLVKNSKNATAGYSEPFRIRRSDLEPIGLYDPPVQDWKSLIRETFFGEGRKTVGRAVRRDDGAAPPSRVRSAYTLEDTASLGIKFNAGDADNVIHYRDNKENRTIDWNSRKKQSGESDASHRARQQAKSRGEDVSNWDPSSYN